MLRLVLLGSLIAALASAQQGNHLTCGDRIHTAPVNHTDAQAAVDQYCSLDLYLEPAAQKHRLTQYPMDGASYDNYYVSESAYFIETRATFVDDQAGCGSPRRVGTRGEECRRALGGVVDECLGQGGGKIVKETQNGCIAWSLFGMRTGPSVMARKYRCAGTDEC